MNIKLIGIDLAKRVFQLCAVSATNKVIFNRQVSRAKLAETLARYRPAWSPWRHVPVHITGVVGFRRWVMKCA